MKVELGKRYRDTATGVEGVATARAEYLHGTPRCGIEPKPDSTGKPCEQQWFDEGRLELIGD